ncbi:neuroendocrine convertase 2 isoform X3 [Narcine bancroftii]|uniref:neuroendocrine convertase 2 isoform X3 n=1 Tax=Narcine bancroftii TaxID=1343680 RepID=UPI0038312D51
MVSLIKKVLKDFGIPGEYNSVNLSRRNINYRLQSSKGNLSNRTPQPSIQELSVVTNSGRGNGHCRGTLPKQEMSRIHPRQKEICESLKPLQSMGRNPIRQRRSKKAQHLAMNRCLQNSQFFTRIEQGSRTANFCSQNTTQDEKLPPPPSSYIRGSPVLLPRMSTSLGRVHLADQWGYKMPRLNTTLGNDLISKTLKLKQRTDGNDTSKLVTMAAPVNGNRVTHGLGKMAGTKSKSSHSMKVYSIFNYGARTSLRSGRNEQSTGGRNDEQTESHKCNVPESFKEDHFKHLEVEESKLIKLENSEMPNTDDENEDEESPARDSPVQLAKQIEVIINLKTKMEESKECSSEKDLQLPFAEGLYHFTHNGIPKARKSRSVRHKYYLERDTRVKHAMQQEAFNRKKRGYRNIDEIGITMNDPLFTKQWYLVNTGQIDGTPGLDLNVAEAWEMGYTGKGVTIAIMDDGIDYLHPDLADNYNAEASYDFSSNDPFPYPRYTKDWFNSHGTRCAGEVSAAANNNICGVGVAYSSKVAGIRMLDQPFMTDIIEASSISHMPQVIDIYSASWGPTDDGKTVDGPRELTLQAMADGVNKGRNGKGSIYVWASGDGGSYDDCNCDGYASSMWTISINSAINDGRTALYDESCSSTLASTFSNGRKRNPEAGVATTDLYGNCTLRHSGTSAAAPEAAAVFALALEANPNLTWRDMQHLTVLTSKRNQLHDDVHKWRRNGVGLEFNHLFGYGVLNAGAMVKMAKDWKTVPERFHCIGGSIQEPKEISSEDKLILTISADACEGRGNFVRYLEHVQAVITINATRRGALNINMTSPMGTKSILLSRRPRDDDSKVGFDKWPFMTTHTWGEDPRGTWIIEAGFAGDTAQKGVLKEWTLMLHGTQSAPYIDQIVNDYRSKLAMSKKEELEEELDEAVERSLKNLLKKTYPQ